jgi:DNA polymerase/3'-5' exonuclease PolX
LVNSKKIKKELSNEFDKLFEIYDLIGENFRALSYRNVSNIIKNFPKKIQNSNELQNIKGFF